MAQNQIIINDSDINRIFTESIDAIKQSGLIIEDIDKREKIIFAHSKTSIISWGEDYYFEFLHHQNSTIIKITASPASFFNFTAYSTIEKNINKFYANLIHSKNNKYIR